MDLLASLAGRYRLVGAACPREVGHRARVLELAAVRAQLALGDVLDDLARRPEQAAS
ncbi:hypothetical protein [Luteitalea pratensis]|uniref:hypothetical protein n=1 Tax=Luteitalea pratensis TaxID=1855912 RepID=UPI0012FFB531|nr:hypothetical protein [Luteitalea pratensis]